MDVRFTEHLSNDFLEEIGVRRKDNVIRFIRKNFRDGIDFKTTHVECSSGRTGGRPEAFFTLTKDTAELVRGTYNMKHKYVRMVQDTTVKSLLMSLENSTIGFMCNALKSLFSTMIRQHKVGKYRVDLYIPDIKLCVECDEGGHKDYNAAKEAERQAYIEKELACKFIRFNPNAPGFDLSDVIDDILRMYKETRQGELT